MKLATLLIPFAVIACSQAVAQTTIWRCGNTYTNEPSQGRNCKQVEGGNVTVVQGTRVQSQPSETRKPEVKLTSAPPSAPRIDADQQRARDSEARAILEAELKKAETRHAELLKEYNNGEPEKMGPEHRNYQKYLDRVAELKASIERNEKDIAGLKRELGRTPPVSAAPGDGTTARQ